MAEFKHTVTKEDEGKEVRDIMRMYFDFSSRLRNKVKREKLVFLNGEQTQGWYKVYPGDVVSVELPEEKSNFPAQPIPLDPVFEDDDLLLLNKQPGLIVHPTKGHPLGTVANALMHYQEVHGQSWKIRFVNRLDMDTSGLLIVAKNAYCQNDLTLQMKKNHLKKTYIAIVSGVIAEDEGSVDAPIGRPDPIDVRRGVMESGAPSVTHYKVLERYPNYTLLRLNLETGRTHQIRVHMSHIGHPVLSDHLYGEEKPYIIERQALHAACLEFDHPATGEHLIIEAPLPEDMKKAIEKIR
ncbi:MAG: RluA family pseudouridine synthase [Firmicutes bacterium]|nr:RluA family pseudouridine synthase [Bacillota bacterium]